MLITSVILIHPVSNGILKQWSNHFRDRLHTMATLAVIVGNINGDGPRCNHYSKSATVVVKESGKRCGSTRAEWIVLIQLNYTI